MGWLRLVGAFKLQVSFAEYLLFYRALLQKRPVQIANVVERDSDHDGVSSYPPYICCGKILSQRYNAHEQDLQPCATARGTRTFGFLRTNTELIDVLGLGLRV